MVPYEVEAFHVGAAAAASPASFPNDTANSSPGNERACPEPRGVRENRRRLSRLRAAAALLVAGISACGGDPAPRGGGAAAAGIPSPLTVEANSAVARNLPLGDQADFDDANRGFLGRDEGLDVRGPGGLSIWKPSNYDFIQGDAPPSVNPSLWRQARLNNIHGLFRVAEGLYQVRGYDIANLTLVRGRTGWIVVDPLTARETAAAALALARRHLGNDPIVAVIFTHSHIDHFGGVGAVLADPHTDAARLRVIAPEGFMEEATSENVLAGLAMGRRAGFMYGLPLERSPLGHVDTGLGKEPARGTIDILEPTDLVGATPTDLEIDGVAFRFQYTPASEAPAELTFHLPALHAFCGAEVVSHNLHNLYTLRGAKVRDALKWSGYIDEAIRLFGDMEVVFASHHWPVFGRERALGFLADQADAYRYIHDQTLRLANQGFGPQEIADQLQMPAGLRDRFGVRGYYGTVRHNAKAVYQAYFGWYDANPANLDPLAPEDAATRYVEAMGGRDAVLARAREAYERGEYRWTSMMLNHLVFAAPEDTEAREALARCYEQMGWQAESGPWRDVYLTGATELRRGAVVSGLDPKTMAGLLGHLEPARFFDAMATRVDPAKADGADLKLNFVFTDVGETHVVRLHNAVLHHHHGDADAGANATVTLTRGFLVRLSTGEAGAKDFMFSDDLKVEGSRLDMVRFFAMLDRPKGDFAIVTP